MDKKEKNRLKKAYSKSELSDEDLLEMLSIDKKEYEKGVYELLLEEAKKRKIKYNIEKDKKDNNEELVVIFSGNAIDSGILENLLKNSGIKVFLRDEFVGTIAPWISSPAGIGSVKVVILKKDFNKAKKIIHRFVNKDS